jgi:hypothetical protein
MKTQKTYGTLIAYLITCMFVVFVTGCGDGGGSVDQAGTTPSTEIDIEAISGPIVAVRVGEVATLDDSRSFSGSTEALSYSWSFSHKPAGSNSTLQGATTASPSFVADVRGVYMVQLVVSAEGISSQRTITTVVVTNSNERRTGRFNHLGLSSNCVNCHNGVNLQVSGELLFPKPPTHIASSNNCQTCHTPQGFNIIPFADHQEVFGNCSVCHDGVTAIGKSQSHTPTDAECDDCHNTISFLELAPDGSFDHSSITRACNGCHNGTVATGKTPTTADTPPGTHPVTNSECGYCHTTASFLNPYPDHTGPDVVGPGIMCDSCHVADGSGSGTGQTVGHPVTTVDCDTCHSISAFKMPGGIFNHSLLDATEQPCESCHNGNNSINAIDKTPSPPIGSHPDTISDCGVCHNTDSFFPAFNNHDGVVDNCQSCHGIDATVKSLNHMPTNPNLPGTINDQDCVDCHTFGTFASGTYNHEGVIDNCASCHDNVITVGKLPNHISTSHLTNEDCSICHTTTAFVPAAFDHVGINVNDCASCHDGNKTIGKANNHLPTAQDCSACHATSNIDSSTFKDTPNFAHTGITGNCESCHSGNPDHVAVGAKGKLPNHIPALNGCDVCHMDTTTGGFASAATFKPAVHDGFTQGCEGCHVSKFLPTANSVQNIIKAPNHLPTNQDCYLCHTISSFIPDIFTHKDISGNCASCHDGSTNNVAVGARGATNTTLHQTTNEDCGTCHNTAAFADAFVDHSGPEVVGKRCDTCHDGGAGGATGKNAGHLTTTQDCAVCHVAGGTFIPAVFDHTGIVDNCASCHNGTDATGLSPGHVDTLGKDCSSCHNTTAFAGAKYDHTGIVNGCATCHDGVTARGKTPPPNHVPTTGDCSDCHQTTGFRPATFDHVGIVDNCRSCHDGAYAIGKTSSHVPTNQDCGVCHTTTSFIGAGFNHTGIVDNCASCHDGSTAPGKHNAHITTALDCHSCHTTATFVGGTWTHDASSVGNCDQCHNTDGGARSKPQGHLSTNVQCDVCHSTDGWAPARFSHSPAYPAYPGDHRIDPGCSGCHGNSIVSPFVYDWPQYAPDCAACHANDFESKDDHIGGKSGTVEQNRNCGGSECHRVSDSNFD